MEVAENHEGKRVLVISDSNIDQDPRVLNQISWLNTAGWHVDTLGQGEKPSIVTGSHHRIGQRSFTQRLTSYIFFPNKLRFHFLMGTQIPQDFLRHSGKYDLVVVNEVDLLPWIVKHGPQLFENQIQPTIHLDLHEFALSQGVGWLWNVLFRRYRKWLTTFVASPIFSSRSVVAPGIADLYVDSFGIEMPNVIRSCPAYKNLTPKKVNPTAIKLIHHGKADLDRGIQILIEAMEYLDPKFNLTLMLVGNGEELRVLKKLAEPFGNRIHFVHPVPVTEVSNRINEFDLEVIVFPPITENLRFALPNKFFESIQGRLGIISGESPSMTAILEEFGNGVIVEGWTAEDIAATINRLDDVTIDYLKKASNVAAKSLNAEEEGRKFIEIIEK